MRRRRFASGKRNGRQALPPTARKAAAHAPVHFTEMASPLRSAETISPAW